MAVVTPPKKRKLRIPDETPPPASREKVDVSCVNHMNQLLDLLGSKKLNLAERDQFQEAWGLAGKFLEEKPVMTKTDLEKMGSVGAVLLQFGASKIEADEALAVTPLQRNLGHVALNTMADYMLLAVARQLTLLMPNTISGIHSFKQLYDGRLITDIFPEAMHTEWAGGVREKDHTKESEDAMRLHVDDSDHCLRAPIQLLGGIRNVMRTNTTFAQVPPDAELQKLGINTDVLRGANYQHCPPTALIHTQDVPKRPILFGPPEAPMIQADRKSTKPVDGPYGPAAAEAWDKLHALLLKKSCGVPIGPGDVLVLDNLRTMHGRGVMEPVREQGQRRWVKRLWLSATSTEALLKECGAEGQMHPRVFCRQAAFERTRDMRHPEI
eukprot:s1612_g3.t1